MEVMDVNDNAPQFVFGVNASIYTAEISESSSSRRVILELQATDADSDDNGLVTFSPSNASSKLRHSMLLHKINYLTYFVKFSVPGFPQDFQISGSQIVRTGDLDFERVQTYIFNVTARDNGDNPLSDEALVVITVTDVNDNSPIFSPSNEYTTDVDEGDYSSNSSVVILVSPHNSMITLNHCFFYVSGKCN